MGRPPGRIQDRFFLMRVTDEFLETIDKWRAKQENEPSRAEAVRRLVELGLKAGTPTKRTRSTPNKVRAAELAAKVIEKIIDPAAPPAERAQRRRRLMKGPTEFREDRVDLPKRKT
jgi:hypothetical protein